MWFPVANLLSQRTMILHLAKTNIKIRFKGTYLGFIWTALEPLLTFILLYVVFTTIRFRAGENFAIYLISGLLLYHIFTRGTMGGLGSLRGNVGILKSLNIKKETFPVASTLTMAILAVVEVGVLVGLMPIFQFIPSWTIILLPIPMILLLILILGFSYFFSIITVFVRDAQNLWAIFVHALLFISPIFWNIKEVDGILIQLHKFNPLGQLIEISHKLVIDGQIPSLEDWIYTSIIIFAIFFLGYFTFQKFQNKVTEEL